MTTVWYINIQLLTMLFALTVVYSENYRVIRSLSKLKHQSPCGIYEGTMNTKFIDCGRECDKHQSCLHFATSNNRCYICFNTTQRFISDHFTWTSSQNIESHLGMNVKLYEKTDILNECLSNPCVHGVCEDKKNAFYCNCEAIYTGTTCNQLISCGSVPSITHGNVQTSKNTVGGIATYTCNAGYFLQGNQHRTCTSSGSWDGTLPTCSSGVPRSYHVLGKTISCSPVDLTTSSNTKTLTCSDVWVDGNMRFPNHDACTNAWKEWSTVQQSSRDILDVASLCDIMVKQISSTASYTSSQVYWGCDSSITRAKFVNNQWSTVNDNGFLKHMKCIFVN